jgi:phasin family protein
MELVMNSLAPEQTVAAQNAAFETMFGLAAKALESFEKLVDLNAQTVKSTLADHRDSVTKVFAVKDAQEFFALQATHAQQSVERAQAYWRHVYEIATSTQAELAAVAEARFKRSQHDAQTFVDGLAKNAPAGSDVVVSAWKSALGAAAESANSAYDAAKKAAQQAIDVAERNVSAASSASTEATRQVVLAGKASGSTKK